MHKPITPSCHDFMAGDSEAFRGSEQPSGAAAGSCGQVCPGNRAAVASAWGRGRSRMSHGAFRRISTDSGAGIHAVRHAQPHAQRRRQLLVVDGEGAALAPDKLRQRLAQVLPRQLLHRAPHVQILLAVADAGRCDALPDLVVAQHRVDRLLQCHARRGVQRQARAADGAAGVLLVRDGVRVHASGANVHHVVVHAGAAHADDLERLQRACRGHDGVGGCDGGDDVLRDALRVLVRDAGNAKLVGALQRLFVHPAHVLLHVRVERLRGALVAPLDEVRVLDAVRRGARRLRQRAQRELRLRREEPEGALEARRHARQDHARVALEALGAAVHNRLECAEVRLPLVVELKEATDDGVHVAARLKGVQAQHNDVEVAIELGREVLDAAVVRRDLGAQHTRVDALRSDLRFGLAHVRHAEQELSVEVGDVDGVHVNDVDVRKAGEREVLQQLAAQAARADHQHAAVLRQELPNLGARLEARPRDVPRACEQLVQVRPALCVHHSGHGPAVPPPSAAARSWAAPAGPA
mmetsp:Transcript_34937/g.88023  ORF Transcript_34937/g.88023 Transcript_34937/m.88023 type:complete len:524 (+) Transcript_34937:51-1622(+)